MEAQRIPSYPQTQVVIRQVPVWPAAQAQAFIRERVLLHRQAQFRLPKCSAMERWQKPDMFAVIKPGAKRALKNHTSLEDATNHMHSMPGTTIQIRPGESTRCRSYCSVSKFCSQFKEAEAKQP